MLKKASLTAIGSRGGSCRVPGELSRCSAVISFSECNKYLWEATLEKKMFLTVKINNLRGDQNDVLAKTQSLVLQ